MRRSGFVAAVGVVLAAGLPVAPASALGATTYVDTDGTAVTACTTPADPCGTIAEGIAAAGPGGEIVVDENGLYEEQVTLLAGQHLVARDFNATPEGSRAIIDGGAGTAVTLGGAGASVENFYLQGGDVTVRAEAPGTAVVRDILGSEDDGGVVLRGTADATGLRLADNIFSDREDIPDVTTAVLLNASADLAANEYLGFSRGVELAGAGDYTLARETFTKTRPGIGLAITAGGVSVDAEDVHFTRAIESRNSVAIAAAQLPFSASEPIDLAFDRLSIVGYALGMRVADTNSLVLRNALIAENSNAGLRLIDSSLPGGADLTAENVTLWNNGLDIVDHGADLTIDSSIVQQTIARDGGESCTITYSRGPALPTACAGFQTNANPSFVGTGAGGGYLYQLRANSPLIDAGNPAAPAAALDLALGPRAVDGPPLCANNEIVRDVGAYEFVPGAGDCVTPDLAAPETAITSGPKKKVRAKGPRSKAVFTFTAGEAAIFQCSLDGGPFLACASPFKALIRTKSRKFRKHLFLVRASDAAGNLEPTPAAYSWKAKRKRHEG